MDGGKMDRESHQWENELFVLCGGSCMELQNRGIKSYVPKIGHCGYNISRCGHHDEILANDYGRATVSYCNKPEYQITCVLTKQAWEKLPTITRHKLNKAFCNPSVKSSDIKR
jgi:hypothetical protein